MEYAHPGTIQLNEADLVCRVVGDIREIFSTMVGRDDLLHLPLQINPIDPLQDSVTAMVGLLGSYNGLICLHTPLNLALKFTSGMLGEEVNRPGNEVHDAMGEIANMIAGSFKQHLSKGGLDIRLSTPSVISGTEYFAAAGKPDATLSLGFAADKAWFMVSATLERKQPKR